MSKKKLCLYLVGLLLLAGGCSSPSPEPSETIPPSPVAVATPTPTPAPTPEPTPQDVFDMQGRNPITGLPYDGAYEPILVMINNDSKASRPQSGMEGADWVYECYIEGAGTRYMAIFNANKPEKVGPVRSCRIYYAQLARGWDGLLIHLGGPEGDTKANVYTMFKQLGMRERLDGLRTDQYFWRSTDRKSPHNAYISLKAVSPDYYPKIGTPEPPPYRFGEAPVDGETANTVTMKLNTFTTVEYRYNEAAGLYDRYENGEKDADKEDGKGVQCANVIVQRCKHSSITPEDHQGTQVVGEGEAVVYMAGKAVQATWKKESAKAHTQYFDQSGEPIIFRAGPTWVQVVKPTQEVTVQ